MKVSENIIQTSEAQVRLWDYHRRQKCLSLNIQVQTFSTNIKYIPTPIWI